MDLDLFQHLTLVAKRKMTAGGGGEEGEGRGRRREEREEGRRREEGGVEKRGEERGGVIHTVQGTAGEKPQSNTGKGLACVLPRSTQCIRSAIMFIT